MRILHTSDWHLGRIFHGKHLTDDQAYILEQFVTLVGDTKPDVILISGDIYDRSVPPTDAVNLLDDILSHILLDYHVPVISIAGNHDSPERLGFGTRLLARQGLYLTGEVNKNLEPIVLTDSHGPVYFCPIPYADPPIVRERLNTDMSTHQEAMFTMVNHLIAQIPPGNRTVALAHAFVAGGEECESERPLSIGGSSKIDSHCFRNFHFTALGHLHRPQHAGETNIRYAGSLMKYSFSEASHRKSVTMVEMDATGDIVTEEMTLTPKRDVRCLEGYLNDILEGPEEGESKDDYLMVTLKDSGAIFDAVGKLRTVYPNVLHIERPHLTDPGNLHGPGGDHRRRSESDLFSDFFKQVTGQPLSAEQTGLFNEIMNVIYKKEREV